MAEPVDDNIENKLQALRELPLTAEVPGLAADELISCGKCTRKSPPNRLYCLYCGAPLEPHGRTGTDLKVNFSEPEPWEEGFSIVCSCAKQPSANVINAAAEILRLETAELEALVSAGLPLPVLYLKSVAEAGYIAERLTNIGFDCAVVGDDLLTPKIAPTRTRSVDLDGSDLLFEDFNTSQWTVVKSDEPVLIVSGTIVRSRSDSSEKQKWRKAASVEKVDTAADEVVLDIYPRSDVFGFRVRASGFDFSCLGERMHRFAAPNMAALAELLQERLPRSVYVDSYPKIAALLDEIWPPEVRSESMGVRREKMLSGIKLHRSSVTDNTIQFTKFSRLQMHFQ